MKIVTTFTKVIQDENSGVKIKDYKFRRGN